MPEFDNNRYIVTENPKVIIQKCRNHSKETLKSFLIGSCIIFIIMNWIPEILGMFFTKSYVEVLSQFVYIDPQLIIKLPQIPVILYFYALFFNGVLKLGEALYTLTYIRNKRVEYVAIAEGFKFYLKALGVYIAQLFIISIWSILFIIPGIIAAINFSQAFYILADDPKKGVFRVLFESKFMMMGNRMNYFLLLINYLPYLLIGYFPSIVLSWIPGLNFSNPITVMMFLISAIPLYAARGYLAMGRGVYYELLKEKGFENFRYSGQEAFREDKTI